MTSRVHKLSVKEFPIPIDILPEITLFLPLDTVLNVGDGNRGGEEGKGEDVQ